MPTSEARTKKFINAPDRIIPELIEGMVGAHPDLLRVGAGTGRAIVAVNGPRPGKVGVVVGGGSGHEPAFSGYVGQGLADACAVGNIFASPSPDQIVDAAREAESGAGVIFVYGNYTGDVMNFDMAAEDLVRDGMPVRSIAVTDDVASAPAERSGERRGIAGNALVFKIVGAAADRMLPLDEVERLGRNANAMTRSMGVALSGCSLPQTAKLNFDVGPGEMEVGMGLHGEPGIRRVPLETADRVAEDFVNTILDDMPITRGEEVAVVVNGLGATTPIELYLLHRRARLVLEARGIGIHRSWVGEYATSLEMAGASITLMKLDAELKSLLDHPCHSLALRVGATTERVAAAPRAVRARTEPSIETGAVRPLVADGDVTPAIFRRMMAGVADALAARTAWLSELDGVIGDGDHGVTMELGWSAIRATLAHSAADETIAALCGRMATAFLGAVGASSGPLYATAFTRAGHAVDDRLNLDAEALARWIVAMAEGIRERGRAEPGDKTMLDAWLPAADQAHAIAQGGGSSLETLRAAAASAETGMRRTADFAARRGRSAKLSDRSVGHIDPGAASAFVILDAMASVLERG